MNLKFNAWNIYFLYVMIAWLINYLLIRFEGFNDDNALLRALIIGGGFCLGFYYLGKYFARREIKQKSGV